MRMSASAARPTRRGRSRVKLRPWYWPPTPRSTMRASPLPSLGVSRIAAASGVAAALAVASSSISAPSTIDRVADAQHRHPPHRAAVDVHAAHAFAEVSQTPRRSTQNCTSAATCRHPHRQARACRRRIEADAMHARAEHAGRRGSGSGNRNLRVSTRGNLAVRTSRSRRWPTPPPSAGHVTWKRPCVPAQWRQSLRMETCHVHASTSAMPIRCRRQGAQGDRGSRQETGRALRHGLRLGRRHAATSTAPASTATSRWSQNQLHVTAKLGFLLSAMKGPIEQRDPARAGRALQLTCARIGLVRRGTDPDRRRTGARRSSRSLRSISSRNPSTSPSWAKASKPRSRNPCNSASPAAFAGPRDSFSSVPIAGHPQRAGPGRRRHRGSGRSGARAGAAGRPAR